MASAVISISSIFLFFIISLPVRVYFSQLETCLVLAGLVSTFAFFKSSITKNYSVIDEFWSLLPSFFAFHLNHWTARGSLMFALVVLWGCRLSFNFWRKGGYQGLEDYRWEHVQKIIPRGILWHLFNLTFISTYQTFLLLAICLPIYFEPRTSLEFSDALSAALCFLLIVGETLADQQQWDFQTEKRRKIAAGQKNVKNFLDSGLFRFSRHPNFFCEISIWWTFFSFTKGVWLAAGGAVLLNLLFHGSTEFTEKLSLQKYPEYKEYQARTSRIIPWFQGKGKSS